MDDREIGDRTLRRALRKAHETNTLRSFGKDYSLDMIQRALNRFHLKTQLIFCLQGLIRSGYTSHIDGSLDFHSTPPQSIPLAKALTDTQIRLRKKLGQRSKQKDAGKKKTSESSKTTAPVNIDALMKQFGLSDEKKAPSRKKGRRKSRTQQKKKPLPQRKKGVPKQMAPIQKSEKKAEQKSSPTFVIPLDENDDSDFILVSHRKTKSKKEPQKKSQKTTRLPLKIVVFPPVQATDTAKTTAPRKVQEKTEAPKKVTITLPPASTLVDDESDTFRAFSDDEAYSSEEDFFLERALEAQDHRALQERLTCLEAAAQGDVNFKAALKMMARVKAAEDLLRALQKDPNSGESTRLLLNKLMKERKAHKKSIVLFEKEHKSLKQTVREQQHIIGGLSYEIEGLYHNFNTLQHDTNYQSHMTGIRPEPWCKNLDVNREGESY